MNEQNFKEIIREITDVISVISILEIRERTLREELNFFKSRWKDVSKEASKKSLFVWAYKRLEHEVMFLSIEVYSLYQGIAEKSSLYSKVIKQNGKFLSKVDKTPIDKDTVIYLGTFDSDVNEDEDFTYEEKDDEDKNDIMKKLNDESYRCRTEIRDDFGITSHKHDEIDVWFSPFRDKDQFLEIKELAEYRDKFAHRLDSLEKLKEERKLLSPDNVEVEKILNVVSTVLDKYKSCLSKILLYTTSTQYLGIKNFKYDSLSRLKLAERLLRERDSN